MTSLNIEPTQSGGFSKAAMKLRAVGLKQRAYSIPDFCAAYGVGRSLAYAEIKAGRLKIRKAGRRTIIGLEDAEDWFAALKHVKAA
jgi:hypothetical protein